MPPLVVDPSALLALGLEDEAADFAEAVLDQVQDSGGAAPSIFWYEVRNVLVVNERRGRLTPEKTSAFLATLAELPIDIPPLPPELGVLGYARTHAISVYDAAYLELAARSGAPLATLDNALRAAATAAGVPLFPGRNA